MRIRCTIMATALVLALSGVAQAGTLYTPPAFAEAGTTIGCQIVNIGKKTIDVTIEVLNGAGNLSNQNTGPVIPGQMSGINGGGDCVNSACYCKFSFKGGKKKLRASACVHDLPDSGCKALVPAY